MTLSHLRSTFLLSLLLLGVLVLTQSTLHRPTPATAAAPLTIERVPQQQGLPIETIPSAFEEIHDTPGTTTAILRLINNQEVEINYTIAILRTGCRDIGGVSWLRATPETGTIQPARPRIVSVIFDSRDLPQGTYTAFICIFQDSTDFVVEVPVSLYAGGGATVTPTATSPNNPPTATRTRTATAVNQSTPTRTPTGVPNQLTPTRTPTMSTGLPTVTRTPTTGAPLTQELFLPLVRRR